MSEVGSDIQGMPESTSSGPARHWLWIALTLFCAGIAYLLFFQKPPIALGVMTGEKGNPAARGNVSDSGVAAHLTALKSNINTSTVSSTSRSNGAAWPRETIVIFCESAHLLMQRIGLELFRRIQEENRFRRVQYVPLGKALPVGEEVPDVLVTIDMKSLEIGGMTPMITYDGLFLMRISRRFVHSSHSVISSQDPPLVNFSMESSIDYQARQTGLETAGARYSDVSKELAKKLQDGIRDYLEKADGTQLPKPSEIPEYFPKFEPPPKLTILKELNAVQKLQGPRFMQPTYAVWTFFSDSGDEELKAQFQKEFPETEWKIHVRSENVPGFSATWQRGNELFEVAPLQIRSMGEEAAKEIGPRHYGMSYSRNLSMADADAAFTALLMREPDEWQLLPFVQQWHMQRDAIERHFEKHPPQHVDSMIPLAEWALREKNVDKGKELILKAATLDRLLHESNRKSRIKKLAKEAGLEELPEEWDLELIASLGLSDIRDGGEVLLELSSGETATLWVEGTPKTQKILKLPVQRTSSGEWRMGQEVYQLENYGRSSAKLGPAPIDLKRTFPVHIGHYNTSIDVIPQAVEKSDVLSLRVINRRRQPDE